ncbi:MAG: ABC transporter substrate-binding protein [Cyanobacteria bacterium]|nr:ABC transporter substrate-binding protein [Cyanobacteriota bacterium]
MMTQAPTLIRVAHSPDSDDAFMFYALAENKVDTEGLTFTHQLTDIETLNHEAMKGTYELTAISYHAYAFIKDKYAILSVGSSVGDKYGPIVISKNPMSLDELKTKKVAIPGKLTTAYLALKIWCPEIETVVVPFDQIMERVQSGEFEAGLIIHEGQLTYKEEGLHKVIDLGEWWFEECNLTLPLGGNAIRRDLGPELIQKIARVLKRSIEYGLHHREEALAHCMKYARGLTTQQADRFVGMYVNDMTLDADLEIQKAVKLLLWRGHGIGLIPEKIIPDFISPEALSPQDGLLKA